MSDSDFDRPPDPGADVGADPPPASAGPPPPQPPRRLARDPRGRLLAGVATGVGAYLGIDPVLVRLAFILLAFAGGLGILLYLVAWLVLPEDQAGASAGDTAVNRVSEAPGWVKAVLAVIGVVIVIGQLGPGRSSLFWAFVLIAIGVLLFRKDDRIQRGEAAPQAGQAAAPESVGRYQPSETATGLTQPAGIGGGWGPPTGAAATSGSTAMDSDSTARMASDWSVTPPWPEDAGAFPSPPRSILGQLTVAVVLLASGAGALLDLIGALDFTFERFLALTLTILGLGLVVGAWVGRARGLIVLGALILPVLAAINFLAVPIEGGVGEQFFRPAALEQVQDDYRLFIGSTTLDLSEVEFEREPTLVSAGVGIGQLEVIVPSDARVEVDGRVRAGEIEAFGERQQGSNLDLTASDPGSELGGRLELDLNAGFGVVSVRRASD